MQPLRVLMVDDEIELVQTIVERLNMRDIDAHGVTSGDEALEQIERGTFDVVVIDVKMPGLGGIQLMRMIRERNPEQQMVLLTGHGSTQDAEEGMRLGAFDYVMKPIRLENLVSILQAAAGRGERTDR